MTYRHDSPTRAWVRAGLVGLAVYGVLVAVATWRPQPDQETEPLAWARFVSSTQYAVEHVASNVVGGVLVVLGTFALGSVLALGPGARWGLTGMVLVVVANVLFLVPGGLSTFATPAIGEAYLAGRREVMEIEFSPVLDAVLVLGLLCALVGNLALSIAMWRSGTVPRGAALLWAASAVVFYLLGAALGMATTGASLLTQPLGGLLLAVAAAWVALAVTGRQHTPSRPGDDTTLRTDDGGAAGRSEAPGSAT
jgi:hypothetical protein